MRFRTRMIGCVTMCLLGLAGCNPGPDAPGGANNVADAGPDTAGSDTMGPDAGGPDAADDFSFDGIASLDPAVVDSDAPEDVALALLTTGEMPEDAQVEVEVDGTPVALADDMTFTPPSRPGMPGVARVAVTIGATTHQTSLRYAIDAAALELDDDRAALDLPGTERATAVWTADTDGDGFLEYLVYDEGAGADESMEMLRVYEEQDDGSLAPGGEVDLPRVSHEMHLVTPTDLDGDGVPDIISVSFLARASSPDSGDRVLQTRLHDGRLTPLEDAYSFEPGDTVLDFMTRDSLDPDTGNVVSSLDALVVLQDGSTYHLRKRPGRAATTDPLGLPEYEAERLIDGTEIVALVPDEAILGSYPTGAIVGMDVDPDTGHGEVLYAPATSHNASRSNRSQGIMSPNGGGDCDDTDPDIKPGLAARITDLDGDNVGDLLVAVGCPSNVAIYTAKGSNILTDAGNDRRYSGAMKLLEGQSDVSIIDTIARQKDGTVSGISSGRCEAGRCEASFVFEIPADQLGVGTLDDVEVSALPAGSPLHEEEQTHSTSPLFEGRAAPGGESGEATATPSVLSPPIVDRAGAHWVPAGGRLTTTIAPVADVARITGPADLSGARAVDVAETSAGTTLIASLRGPVQLRNADQAKADGGALIRTTEPRVVVARCPASDEEKASSARTWSSDRCGEGLEVEELTPPDGCVWNGQVSLHRAADGSYVDARIGIVPEEHKKTRVRRYRSSEALSQGSDLGTVEFPEAPGEVVAVGDRVFSIDEQGEIWTGTLMGGGALLNEVRLQSTGIMAAIRAELGGDGDRRSILPVRIQGAAVDHGLVLTAESAESGPFVVMWNPGATEESVSWWGHCNGWTSGRTDDTPNAHLEAVASSYDSEAASIVDDLIVVQTGQVAADDEVFRVRPGDDACGAPLFGGNWPAEHICPSGERCRGGISSTGDLDGDGYGDAIIATDSGPVLYSNITASEAERVGPIRWMAPEHLHRFSGPSGGQIVVGEDGTAAVAPPTMTFLDGVLSPYLPQR